MSNLKVWKVMFWGHDPVKGEFCQTIAVTAENVDEAKSIAEREIREKGIPFDKFDHQTDQTTVISPLDSAGVMRILNPTFVDPRYR